MHTVEKSIEIDAPVERVFDMFSDFESFPRWMHNIKEVRRTGRRYTRWAADAPLGMDVEWEAETVVFEPDHRIVWRSVRGDIDTSGEVIFTETERDTTLLRIVLSYDPPAGRLGEAVARLFGKDPEHQLEEDLERFRDIVERRERRQRGRHYDRGYEQRVYHGEGRDLRQRRGRDDYDYNAYRYRERRQPGMRDERERYAYDTPRNYEIRDDRDDEERRRERRFNEALREARRSQLEGQRRYMEEREREERRRRGRDDWQRDQRAEAPVQRPDETRRYEPYRDKAPEEEGAYRPRYALTPRERERERAEERTDREYLERMRHRGIDRLLDDEPPSRHWRRWE